MSVKSWIYKGVYVTYLHGHTSSYINDFVYFPVKTIEVGTHQEWLVSKSYNKTKLPDYIKTVNDS